MKTVSNLFAFASGLLATPAAFAGLIVTAPVDVIGNVSLADFTANNYGGQSWKDWGNEPFVAVNPLNTDDVFVSSFAPPLSTSSTAQGARAFYSTTGGSSWGTQFLVPAPANGVAVSNDWNFAYNGAGILHGAVLGSPTNIYQGMTANPAGGVGSWSYTGGGTRINMASPGFADQPWIALQGANVFVAYDAFQPGFVNPTERVTVSANNGTTFPIDISISNGAQANSVNPGTRIATNSAGIVYSIFGVGSPTGARGVNNVTYYLNRSGNGGVTWDFNGSSAVGGIVIDSGVSTQLCNACTQASNNWFANVNDLRGNITAIASDRTGAHVYVLIGKQDASGTDRIYLAAYQPSGSNLVKTSEIVVSPAGQRAALPAITVKDDGTVVLMYETFNAQDGQVHIHVASSDDFGASISSDIEEYAFTPLPLAQATGSTTSNREFGDYDFLMSIGDTFYGVFAGLGDVNIGGINTTDLIDPFFFSGTDVPEPGSLGLLSAALFGLGFLHRRRSAG